MTHKSNIMANMKFQGQKLRKRMRTKIALRS